MSDERVVQIAGRGLVLGRYDGLVPALSADARAELREEIARRGVLVPVLVDEFGAVLDGRNRVEIAAELGLDRLPVEVISGRAEEEKREIAVKVNTCRRQLSREERAEVARCLVAAGLSQRAAAQQMGVHKNTVARDLDRSAGPPGPPEQAAPSPPAAPPKRKGLDGKGYPAAKPEPKQIKERGERVKEKAKAGKTTRQIAKEEGVSVGTVARDLQARAAPQPSRAVEKKLRAAASKLVPGADALIGLADELAESGHRKALRISEALDHVKEARRILLSAADHEAITAKE